MSSILPLVPMPIADHWLSNIGQLPWLQQGTSPCPIFRLYSQGQLPWVNKQLIDFKSKICKLNSSRMDFVGNDIVFRDPMLFIILWYSAWWGIELQNQETWGLISVLFLICWCNFSGPQLAYSFVNWQSCTRYMFLVRVYSPSVSGSKCL